MRKTNFMDGQRGAWEGWKSSTCNSPSESDPAIKMNVNQNFFLLTEKVYFSDVLAREHARFN